MRIFLTHVPDMLENYYGPRALAEMRKLGEVRLNTSGKVLDAKALAEAAKGCEIIVSDRQTPGPARILPARAGLLRIPARRGRHPQHRRRGGKPRRRAGDARDAGLHGVGVRNGDRHDDRFARAGLPTQPSPIARGRKPSRAWAASLHGATVGIMGYGAISRHLAPICVALGMKVLVADPYAKVEDPRLHQVPLETLLAQSDFVDLSRGRQRADREPDERGEFRAHEEERLFPQPLARQSGGRGRAARRRWTRSRSPAPRWMSAAPSTRNPRSSSRSRADVIATPHTAGLTPDSIEHQAFDTVRQVGELVAGRIPPEAVNRDKATRLTRLGINDLT